MTARKLFGTHLSQSQKKSLFESSSSGWGSSFGIPPSDSSTISALYGLVRVCSVDRVRIVARGPSTNDAAGADGFGFSDTRAAARRHYFIDAHSMATRALQAAQLMPVTLYCSIKWPP